MQGTGGKKETELRWTIAENCRSFERSLVQAIGDSLLQWSPGVWRGIGLGKGPVLNSLSTCCLNNRFVVSLQMSRVCSLPSIRLVFEGNSFYAA